MDKLPENIGVDTQKNNKIKNLILNITPIIMGVIFSQNVANSAEVFKNTEKLDFSGVLEKKIDKTKYEHVWGKENITYDKTTGEMKIFYPEGSYKPSSNPRGGAGFIYNLEKPLEYANLSYKVMFEDGFDFVKGGKLPGFCGGDCPRGGEDANNGFSVRFMWRTEGDLEAYPYIPTKTGKYGDSLGRGLFRFETGKLYELSQTIKLNTPGKDDGEIIVYVDGKEIYRNNNIVYRDEGREDIKLDKVLFSTFFGGNDDSYATKKDTSTFFKDFNIKN